MQPRLYCPLCGDAIGGETPVWQMPDNPLMQGEARCRNCETTITFTLSVKAQEFTTNHVAACVSMLANRHVKDIPGREHEDTKASRRHIPRGPM